jgi:phage baseplate assembly protein W
MADIAHVVGEDLQLSSSGDLAMVAGHDETQQRILHRLLTGSATYIWQLSYGAGLPGLIGSAVSQQQIAAIIRAQMAYEPTISSTPEPKVSVLSSSLGVTTAVIAYTDATSGDIQTLTVPVGG